MNARKKLLALQAARDKELRAASRHALRFTRHLAPTRALRTHMPAALGIAVLTGIALAPAPRYRRDVPSRPPRPSLLMSLLAKLFPQWHAHLVQVLPPETLRTPAAEAPTPSAEPAPPPAPPAESPLIALIMRLVQEVNWAVLIARLSAHFAPPPPAPDPTPPSPMPTESAELPH